MELYKTLVWGCYISCKLILMLTMNVMLVLSSLIKVVGLRVAVRVSLLHL